MNQSLFIHDTYIATYHATDKLPDTCLDYLSHILYTYQPTNIIDAIEKSCTWLQTHDPPQLQKIQTTPCQQHLNAIHITKQDIQDIIEPKKWLIVCLSPTPTYLIYHKDAYIYLQKKMAQQWLTQKLRHLLHNQTWETFLHAVQQQHYPEWSIYHTTTTIDHILTYVREN